MRPSCLEQIATRNAHGQLREPHTHHVARSQSPYASLPAIVSSRCQLCGKSVAFGHNVSHSNRKTNRRWLPNVQKTSVLVNGVSRRIYACTRCIRTLRKQTTS